MEQGVHGMVMGSSSARVTDEAETDLRRGPWTVEEDLLLVNHITIHGEGRWNSLARSAGLKRSGKSCRLRWLNYLRPDVRRGNLTAEEQLLILDLHSRWGNRWSKIAQHLPGRTDNEIKNYWRTRVQKHAKHLKCDANSQQFRDAVRYLWMPRLLEKIQQAAAASTASSTTFPPAAASATVTNTYVVPTMTVEPTQHTTGGDSPVISLSPGESSRAGSSSESSTGTWLPSPPDSDLTADCYDVDFLAGSSSDYGDLFGQSSWEVASGFLSEEFWAADDICFLQQQL